MRIAHISDLHALDLRGVSPLRFFNKRLLGGINLLRKRAAQHPVRILDALCADLNRIELDHVVVTGDLSNLSFPSELARARQAIDTLRLGPANVSIIPGNHDVYVWEAYFGRHFEHAFADYCEGDVAQPQGGPRFPFVRVRGDVAIVGCSTALPSPPPLADGWLGKRQLEAIGQALDSVRGRFRMLLIHHPPLPQRLDLLRALRDRKALHRVLGRVGCELVLHGHEHRDLRGSIPGPDGPIPIIGVGSGTFADPRPDRCARYNIYTVTPAPAGRGGFQLSVEQRVYAPASDSFGPPSPSASAVQSEPAS
jgi:3',5'-cyclic AMP phosphodiesterase CpdA